MTTENGTNGSTQIGYCWNDWDPLKEVIVGRMDGKPPTLHDEPATRKKFKVSLTPENTKWAGVPTGASLTADERSEKAFTCVDNFVQVLKDQGIEVLRPEITDFTKPYKHPDWEVAYQYGSPCPRDLFIKFGDLVVETHSGWRCRYFETQAYQKIFDAHCSRYNCRWISMPKGKLTDDLYPPQEDYIKGTNFNDTVAIVEAADIRRFGRDVFMQYGGFSNKKGFDWMKRLLKGEGIDLHHYTYKDYTKYYHIDTKLLCVEEGTALYTKDHEPSDEIKKMFKDNDWNMIPLPGMREVRASPEDFCSSGLNMNVLVTKPGSLIADVGEKTTVKFFREELGYDVTTMDFSWCMEFGGAFNCWTLDTIRDGGKPKKYFERL